MKIAYADASRSVYSSRSPPGKALPHAFAAVHHSSSPTPPCKWLQEMVCVLDRYFQHMCSWSRRQAEVWCCSWVCLTALWIPYTEQARLQDSMLNQAQSPSSPSPCTLLARWQAVFLLVFLSQPTWPVPTLLNQALSSSHAWTACSGCESTATVVCHVPVQSQSWSNDRSPIQCPKAL